MSVCVGSERRDGEKFWKVELLMDRKISFLCAVLGLWDFFLRDELN